MGLKCGRSVRPFSSGDRRADSAYPCGVACVAIYRVRWFEEKGREPVPEGADVEEFAVGLLAGNPTLAVTVEADNGDGPALLVGVGGGVSFLTDYWGDEFDRSSLIARVWSVEGAYEDVSPIDTTRFVFAESDEELWESGVRGVRLLTAESSEHGRPVVLRAGLYDSDEYEARMREYEADL